MLELGLLSGKEQEVKLVLGMLEDLQFDEEHCVRSLIGLWVWMVEGGIWISPHRALSGSQMEQSS